MISVTREFNSFVKKTDRNMTLHGHLLYYFHMANFVLNTGDYMPLFKCTSNLQAVVCMLLVVFSKFPVRLEVLCLLFCFRMNYAEVLLNIIVLFYVSNFKSHYLYPVLQVSHQEPSIFCIFGYVDLVLFLEPKFSFIILSLG